MVTLRTTVIMKTDLGGSTPRFRAMPEADLGTLLDRHRRLVTDGAASYDGEVVKPEGDAFWLTFPSVTAACLAAVAIQEELRIDQVNKGDDRLAMRIVVTLGDVMREEEAFVGDAVVLAARIESLTPPDETYLSQAAWLAVKPAEVATSYVGAFPLKGFDEPVSIYRVDSVHRTRVLESQYILATDLAGFGDFVDSERVAAVEKVLDALLESVERVCREQDGTVRFSAGDAHCLTFAEPDRAMEAAERLGLAWSAFRAREAVPCQLNVAVHRGTLNAYRSYLYGRDVEVVFRVERAASEPGVHVTGVVRRDLEGTAWARRLKELELSGLPARMREIGVYRLST